MESRIKERLTGALILVAALVVLVPEIFSGRRGSESAQPEAAAPAADAPPLRTYTSEPDAAAPPFVQGPAEVAPPVEQLHPRAAETAPATVAEVQPPLPAPAARPTQDPKPAPATPPPPAASGGDWYVQVGSFSQTANAQRYAQQLRAEGFAVVVLPPSGTKSLVRVRVGPARTREAAAQLATKLTAAGHKGAVVGP